MPMRFWRRTRLGWAAGREWFTEDLDHWRFLLYRWPWSSRLHQAERFDRGDPAFFAGWVLMEAISVAIRRATKPECTGVQGPTRIDPAEAKRLPNLLEYLTLDVFEDGTPRKTSSLTVFVGEGRIKAVLNDREEGRALWGDGMSISQAIAALEASLSEPEPQWRWDRSGKGGPKNSRR